MEVQQEGCEWQREIKRGEGREEIGMEGARQTGGGG